MKPIAFIAFLFLIAAGVWAQDGSTLQFTIVTGSDDLRGGNTVFFKINFTDNTSSDEKPIGGGYGQNSSLENFPIQLDGSINLRKIRSITLRHDGSPRNGHPFDSYDNWDLQALGITLINEEDGEPVNIYNSVNDPKRSNFVQRFTGGKRTLTVWRQK